MVLLRVGPRRIGRGRQHVLQPRHLDDVGRVPAAGAFGVEGVDGAALERLDGVLDKAEFVERVGVDHHLDVVVVGDREAAVDRGRRRAPVLVQLERAGAGFDHFFERRRPRRVALAGKAEIDRKIVGRLDHARNVPRPGRAGGGERAVRRAGAAAEHRGDAGHQRLVDLLRADEMDVGVEAAGGEDFAFAGDHLGAGPDDDGDAGLDVRIAGLADGVDVAVLEADIGFDDAPMVENERVGDDGVDGALLVGDLALPHAVADDFAAAELHLFAVGAEILLDLDDEIGVGEPHAVAGRRAEHVGVDRAADVRWHNVSCCLLRYCRSSLHEANRLDRKSIPSVIPTAVHQALHCTLLLASRCACVSSLVRSLAFGSPDERGRQGQIGLVLKPLPA